MKSISRRQLFLGVLGALIGGAGTVFRASGADLNRIEVTTVRIPLVGLSPAFHGYRIAQISDIHMGTAIQPENLAQIITLVNAQAPNLVAITGDFIHFRANQFYDGLVSAFLQVNAPDGVVAVLGNHDHWTNPGMVRRILSQSQVIELNNDVYTLERGSAVLNIAGVDDVWAGRARLDRVLKRLPKVGPAILLAHEPDFADLSAASERFSLQMSGHSHGGQIILPFVGPPILPALGRKYPLGRYQLGTMVQYTNRGVGTAQLQVRINCRPEITIFRLEMV